jgi:hypothetical protein
MYVCTYVCRYMGRYAYMYASMYVCMHIYIYIYDSISCSDRKTNKINADTQRKGEQRENKTKK